MIIVTPTARWLESALAHCSTSLTVSSPYIGDYFAKTVSGLPETITAALLTRTLITDFASHASDLEAVCNWLNEVAES